MRLQPSRTSTWILCFACSGLGTKNSWGSSASSLCIQIYVYMWFTKWIYNTDHGLHFRQIDRDCEFLEAERIMDYSLLVGLHFRDDLSADKMGMPLFPCKSFSSACVCASYDRLKSMQPWKFSLSWSSLSKWWFWVYFSRQRRIISRWQKHIWVSLLRNRGAWCGSYTVWAVWFFYWFLCINLLATSLLPLTIKIWTILLPPFQS